MNAGLLPPPADICPSPKTTITAIYPGPKPNHNPNPNPTLNCIPIGIETRTVNDQLYLLYVGQEGSPLTDLLQKTAVYEVGLLS